jgi:hypothetical protein
MFNLGPELGNFRTSKSDVMNKSENMNMEQRTDLKLEISVHYSKHKLYNKHKYDGIIFETRNYFDWSTFFTNRLITL